MTNTAIDDEKRHGQHYTPAGLATFLATEAAAWIRHDDREITILDPACGDGELLLAAAHAVRARGDAIPLRLIGFDIDQSAVSLARERLESAGLRAEVHHEDFLAAHKDLPSHSIDLLITNPPYVRTQHLGRNAAQLLATEFGLSGRVDLTHAFVTTAARLLRPDGVLGLLCSNRVLTTLAGENVRRTLLDGAMQVRAVYDLGDTKLFKAAVLPAVIIATRGAQADQTAKFVSAYELPASAGAATTPLMEALTTATSGTAIHAGKQYDVRVGAFVPPPDHKTPWRLSSPDSDRWLASVRSGTWKTFGEVAKIRVGIKSTADKVFIRSDWGRVARHVEQDLLVPLITSADIAPWSITYTADLRVLYPYDLTSQKRRALNLQNWPGAKRYLETHEEQLRSRKYVVDSGREWWEIWVPQRPSDWATPKIVFPDISEQPRFALDTSGAVVNGNCYWISLNGIPDDVAMLMLAVANSATGLRFYDEVCGNRLYAGKRRWITQYVNRLPVPDPSTPEAAELIAYARAMMTPDPAMRPALDLLDAKVEAAFAATGRALRTELG